jgi:hypothetical protein
MPWSIALPAFIALVVSVVRFRRRGAHLSLNAVDRGNALWFDLGFR